MSTNNKTQSNNNGNVSVNNKKRKNSPVQITHSKSVSINHNSPQSSSVVQVDEYKLVPSQEDNCSVVQEVENETVLSQEDHCSEFNVVEDSSSFMVKSDVQEVVNETVLTQEDHCLEFTAFPFSDLESSFQNLVRDKVIQVGEASENDRVIHDLTNTLTPPTLPESEYSPNCTQICNILNNINKVFSSSLSEYSFMGQGFHPSGAAETKLLLHLNHESYSKIKDFIWSSLAGHKQRTKSVDFLYALDKVRSLLRDNESFSDVLEYELYFKQKTVWDDYNLTLNSCGRCAATTFYISYLLHKGHDNKYIANKVNFTFGTRRSKFQTYLNEQRQLLKDNIAFNNYLNGLWSDTELGKGNLVSLSNLNSENWCPLNPIAAWLSANRELNINMLHYCSEKYPDWFFLFKTSTTSSDADKMCSFSWKTLSNVNNCTNTIFLDKFHTWSTLSSEQQRSKDNQVLLARVKSSHDDL